MINVQTFVNKNLSILLDLTIEMEESSEEEEDYKEGDFQDLMSKRQIAQSIQD